MGPLHYIRVSLPSVTARAACLLAGLCVARPALAHPGSGIVVDRHGNVFFVIGGSAVVMKLGRDGRAAPFVSGDRFRVIHHLVLGDDGSLFTASDHDGIVWRVAPDGSMREHFNSTRIKLRRTFPPLAVGTGGDPFTVDRAGNVYALGADRNAVIRIARDGTTQPVATNARFGDLHFSSMRLAETGTLYLTDANRVWRISGDSAVAIVPRGIQLSMATGVTLDSANNIYVADYENGRVIRFDSTGAKNTPRWLERMRVRNPTGLTIAGGDLYVLDSPPGGTAVWRVRNGQAERLYSKGGAAAYVRWAFPGILILLAALVVTRVRQRRNARR